MKYISRLFLTLVLILTAASAGSVSAQEVELLEADTMQISVHNGANGAGRTFDITLIGRAIQGTIAVALY